MSPAFVCKTVSFILTSRLNSISVPSLCLIPILRPLTLPSPLLTTCPVQRTYFPLYFFHSLSFCDSVILFSLPNVLFSSSKEMSTNPSEVFVIFISSSLITSGAIDSFIVISTSFIILFAMSVPDGNSESDVFNVVLSALSIILSPIFFISTCTILHRRFLPINFANFPV